MDKSKFIPFFAGEAQNILTVINQGLVRLEQDPDNRELWDELLRAAHTLKGSARMLGFKGIEAVSHKIEAVFSLSRNKKIVFSSPLADSLFHILDVIQIAITDIAQGKEEGIEAEGLCHELDVAIAGTETQKQKRETKPAEAEAREQQSRNIAVADVATITDDFMRVSVDRINQLLNLIGEVVISKVKSSYKIQNFKRITKQTRRVEKMFLDLGTSLKDALNVADVQIQTQGSVLRSSPELEKAGKALDVLHQVQAEYSDLRGDIVNMLDDIKEEIFYLNPIIEALQQKMKEVRMLPCSTVFESFPRMIRDIAREKQKSVIFTIRGEETELDKRVLESMRSPLMHVLRNAVDHGVGAKGKGAITLTAEQIGGYVVIEVTDDGPGISLDKVRDVALQKKIVEEEELSHMTEQEVMNLVFAEGFSTAPIITDVSGRGIGLNAVRAELRKLKGTVSIKSELGKGTTIHIELPLTIAILQALLVEAGGNRWAFPTLGLEETVKISLEDIATIENRMIVQIREQSVPVVRLSDVLNVQDVSDSENFSAQSSDGQLTLVIASLLDRRIGFLVDKVIGGEEVFIKNIGSYLGNVNGVSGAAIMGSGETVVILDTQGLISKSQFAHPAMRTQGRSLIREKKLKLLVVEDSFTTREMEKTILENSGYEVETAIDGLDALNKLNKASFAAVVSDIRMPRMNGFELCESMRKSEMFREIPVIFVTALSTEEERRKGIEVGAHAYITKGQFDQGNLLETLKRLIG